MNNFRNKQNALLCLSLLSLLSCTVLYSQDLATINEMSSFVKKNPELPKPENDNLLKPDYTQHYKKAVRGGIRSFISRLFQSLYLKKPYPWTPQGFKNVLEEVVALRTKHVQRGDFIQRLTLPSNAKVVIWGDLQGALHSLSRDLIYLHEQKIIDNNLVITAKDHYFVFNGDLIDRSPYNLETLTIVLQLLKKNPDRVFYIRGNHEERERWMDFDLRRQLEIQAKDLSDESPPLETLINGLFDTLPLALYLTSHSNKQTQVVRISHYGRNESRLNEERFSSFLEKPGTTTPDLHDLSQKLDVQKDTDSIAYPIIVRGISRSTIYQPTDGLTLMAPDQGATAWTLLSAPTHTYQKLYEFFNDAFCIISIGPTISKWTITLYKQDSRKKDGFKQKKYNMLLGQEEHETLNTAKGEGKETLVIASTIDQTKSSKSLGQRLKEGLTMSVNQINRKGGIGDTRLQLVVYDDYYTASRTKKLVEEFKQNYHGSILLTPLGTPTTKSLIPQIKSKEILVLFPYSGAGILRDKNLTNIIHYRTSYDNEARGLIRYALDKMKKRRFAFFFQDDSYGHAPLKASQDLLREAGITQWCEAPYMANSTEVTQAVEKIKEFSPDVILFFSTLPPSAELIRKLGAEYLATKDLMGISFLTDRFRTFLAQKGISFIISRVVPNPQSSQTIIAQEYRQAAQEEEQALSADAFEAYINAALFKEALSTMKPPFTHEKIVQHIENMVDYSFKGLNLNFDPETRELSKNIWIDVDDDSWIFYDVAKLFSKDAAAMEKQKKAEKIVSDPLLSPEKEDKIILGSTLWLSERGGLSPSIKNGIELRIKQANKSGGLRGKRIEVIFLDDNYEPDKARENAELLLNKYKTNVMIAPNGSATLQGYLDFVEDSKLLVMFPVTGAHPFRKSTLRDMVHIRASYPDEAQALTNYAIDTLQSKRIAIFYQQDLFGQTGLEHTLKVLKEKGITDILEVSYQRRTAAMKKQAETIHDYNPDTILFYATDKAGAALIRDLGTEYLGNKNLLGYSDFSITWFQDFIKEKGLSFAVAQILPNWQKSQEAIVDQFRNAVLLAEKQQAGAANQFVLEGYLATDLALTILEKTDGPLIKENIIKTFESFKDFDYKGLSLDFNSKTRELARTIWIDPGSGKEWIKQDLPDPESQPDKKIASEVATKSSADTTKSALSIDHGDTIVVGSSIWVSEGKGVGPSRMKGMSLRANEQNKKGGVNGKKLKIVFLDDKYTPEGAQKNAHTLINQHKSPAFVCPGGTPTLEAYIDLVKDKKFFVFFPSTGADMFRTPELDHLVHIRASYGDESRALVEYASKNFKTKRLAIFYQNDSYGHVGLEAARIAAKKLSITDILEVPYERKAINLSAQKKKIIDFKPDTILLFATTKPAAALIKQMGAQNLSTRHILVPSPLTLEWFKKLVDDNGLQATYSNVMPNWLNSDLPIVRQFRDELITIEGEDAIERKVGDSYILEGYLTVDLMIDIIKRTGENLSLDKIIETINNTKNYEYKGLNLSLNPATHALANNVWIQPEGQTEWIIHS